MPRISELPALAQATSGDVIPIVDDAGNITKKVTADKVVPDGSVVTNNLANSAVTSAKIDWTTLAWTTYTPTVTGFSVVPSGATYRYRRLGNTVDVWVIQPNNGTSNSTSFTISLPFTASANSEIQVPIVQPVDGGTVQTSAPGIAAIVGGGTVVTLYRALTGGPWASSGGKRTPNFMITYECVP